MSPAEKEKVSGATCRFSNVRFARSTRSALPSIPVTCRAPASSAAIDQRPSWLAMSSTDAPLRRSSFMAKIAWCLRLRRQRNDDVSLVSRKYGCLSANPSCIERVPNGAVDGGPAGRSSGVEESSVRGRRKRPRSSRGAELRRLRTFNMAQCSHSHVTCRRPWAMSRTGRRVAAFIMSVSYLPTVGPRRTPS